MSSRTKSRWEEMRTPETHQVEHILRKEFPKTDAYRYNSASIRVRIEDHRFRGKTQEQRDALVEPLLAQLPRATQADIMNLVLLYPGETGESIKALFADTEFKDPSPSIL